MQIVADTNIPYVQSAFSHFGEVRTFGSQQINHSTVKNADVILVRSETRVDKVLLEGSKVRFVGSATIGTDHVDIEYLRAQGIGFANAPGSNANSVAEYVIAALLMLGKRKGFALKGKTLGAVGVGNIGSRVVHMAEAFGMQVLQNDPPLARATAESRFLPLDDLMEADIVTLHVPLTRQGEDATFHLFDKERLAKMKPGSILINTARGAVVETEALKNALTCGAIRAAVIDVWENEPAIDVDLLALTDVGTPHIAGYSLDGKVNATSMIYKEVCHYFGLPVEWYATAEMPAPEITCIQVANDSTDIEDVIRSVVKQCYDIERDDRKLRALLSLPKEQRWEYFKRLRAEYPIRREFFNTTVVLSSKDAPLSEILKALGFKVELERKSEVE
jgi:erythronate-4-phosphate dehydrogenase